MVKKFVKKMIEENSEGIKEYLKDESGIFIEYFSPEQLERIKRFADEHINVSEKDLDTYTSQYGVYEGLNRDWIRFYILTDYMEYYVLDLHEEGKELVYRDFKLDLNKRSK